MHNNVQSANQQIILISMMIMNKMMMMLMHWNSEETMKISGRSNTMIIIQALWMRSIKSLTSDRLQQDQQASKDSFIRDLFNLYLQKNLLLLMIEHKRLCKKYKLLLRTKNHDYLFINYSKMRVISQLYYLFIICRKKI